MKPEKSLRSRALEWLSKREFSRAELARKLAPFAQSEDELEQVLAEFAERNWQSDHRFTEAYIHSKSHAHGSLRLQQALQQKGVDQDTIRALLPDREDELANAIAVLRKKFKSPPADLPEKQKQMRFLAYRGFSMDTIQTALKHDWNAE